MIATQCQKCQVIIRVVGKEQDVARLLGDPKWRVNFPCVVPRCGGRAQRIPYEHTLIYPSEDLPVESYFKALHGFGLPGNKPATAPRIHRLLLEKRVVDADLVSVGVPGRCVVNSMTLEDGTVLHFAPGSQGACIYHVEETLNDGDSLDARTDPENGAQGRSEAGLPPAEAEGSERPNESHELHGRSMPSVPEAGGVSAGDNGERTDGHDSRVRVRAPIERASGDQVKEKENG